MKSSDELVRAFRTVRVRRDQLKSERNSLLCERTEAGPPADFDWDKGGALPESGPPCWKAARQWDRGDIDEPPRRFYFDPPPAEWCESCQRRQEVSDAYREAVRQHGAALRGLMLRGKALSKEVA